MRETRLPGLQGLGSELAQLMLAQLFVNACLTATRMAAPLRALHLGHGETEVGLLIALFAVGQMGLALPAGRYCDRHGLKRPMTWAIVVAAAGAAVAAAWPVYPALCASALLVGGAGGAAIIAVQRHTARLAADAAGLRKAFAWVAIGLALSNVVGPMVAGVMIDRAGFGAAFLAIALLSLLSWPWVRSARERVPAATADAGAQGGAWDLWRDPALRRLLVVTWLLAACWDVHVFLVPVLGHEHGFSASVIGSILGAFGIGAAAVRLLTPLVASSVREWAFLLGAMAATAALFGLYPMLHAPLAMGACSVLLGLTLGSVQPMVMSLLFQLAPAHRHGDAAAMRVVVINVSSVGIPVVAGLAGSLFGAGVVFWAAGVLVGAGTRLALGLRRP